MSTWVWIVIAIAAVIVVAAIVWNALRARRTRGLREGFGPEYDRTVADAPSKREAEADLEARRKRREQLDIRALSQSSRDRDASQWKDTQARLVDDPVRAHGDAHALVQPA